MSPRRATVIAFLLLSLAPGGAWAKKLSTTIKLGGAKTQADVNRAAAAVRATRGVLSVSATTTKVDVIYDDRQISRIEIQNSLQHAGFWADGIAPDAPGK